MLRFLARRREISQTRKYFDAVISSGRFPPVPVPIVLARGEFGLLTEWGSMWQMRAHRYSTGASLRLLKPLWVSRRDYHSYSTLDQIGLGTISITNYRVMFTGTSKTAHLPLSEIVEVYCDDQGRNIIHSRRLKTPLILCYDSALIGSTLIQLFTSCRMQGNLLPEGYTLRIEPDESGRGVVWELTPD